MLKEPCDRYQCPIARYGNRYQVARTLHKAFIYFESLFMVSEQLEKHAPLKSTSSLRINVVRFCTLASILIHADSVVFFFVLNFSIESKVQFCTIKSDVLTNGTSTAIVRAPNIIDSVKETMKIAYSRTLFVERVFLPEKA